MANDTYLNIVTFPLPLVFKNSALGIRRRIKIGDLLGTIYLPCSNIGEIDDSRGELIPPRIKNVDFAVRVYQNMHRTDKYELPWGKYSRWHPKDLEGTAIAVVYRAVVAFSAVQGGRKLSVEDLAEKCIELFPAWSSRLFDWIEVLTTDDLNAAHPLHAALDPPLWISEAWIHPKGNGIDYSLINPPITIYGTRGENSMDATLWTRVIRAANSSREIPEVWALIRDARAAQRRHLGRRAVLDAATAAELIIEENLRRQLLRKNPKPFVDKIMKSNWQVSRRVELMKSLRMWLPPNIEVNLLKLRNDVVHNNAGVPPSAAKDAVDVAEQFARKYESASLK